MAEKFNPHAIEELENVIGSEGFGRVMLAFIEELAVLRTYFDGLDDSVDYEEATRQAHTLKSISSTFGASALQAEALAMEEASRDEIATTISNRTARLIQLIDEATAHYTQITEQ